MITKILLSLKALAAIKRSLNLMKTGFARQTEFNFQPQTQTK
jgi:hypothetical protein